MSSDQNIQLLLAEEQKSKQIIETARTERKLKLEKATNDAQFEITQLLQTQTNELLQYEQQLTTNCNKELALLEEEKQEQIHYIEEQFESNLDSTVEWILQHVFKFKQ